MSLWQQRQRNVSQLWTRLLVISFLMHVLALVLLFVMYRGSTVDYHIQIGKIIPNPDVMVVFMPLAKSIQPKQSVKSGKKKQVVASKKKNEPASHKKTTLKAATKKSTKKVVPKKRIQKKAVKEKTTNKAEKITQKKEAIPEKREKAVSKKPQEVESPAESLVPESTRNPIAPVEQQTVQEHAAQEHAAQEVLYIGQAERDALEMERLIQQEVEDKWRPPMGLSKDLVCDIKVLVGWDGKAQEIEIVQASGILVYDIHARATVSEMTFPRSAHGKQLCMHFKQ